MDAQALAQSTKAAPSTRAEAGTQARGQTVIAAPGPTLPQQLILRNQLAELYGRRRALGIELAEVEAEIRSRTQANKETALDLAESILRELEQKRDAKLRRKSRSKHKPIPTSKAR